MLPLTESSIRSSFVNASRKEVKDMSVPDGLDEYGDAAWDALDFLGWRDAKFARRAYVVLPRIEGEPVGVALRQAEGSPRSRAMCNWCRDVRLPNEVVFWSAKRTGAAGRRGGTIGILICQDFQCCRNVRNDPPKPYDGYDMAAARERRIDDLRMRVDDFAADLLGER
ncbi:FBP domain-containing protein [Microbacterium halophytorum]|uniref:FBP domain-containing protein n=1 Tax=Microbacterium halophytorum TaxID=2067568 RepID=UPI000CFCED0A|nr:FBP domain-containing protein [Microbacterium halophytorum]